MCCCMTILNDENNSCMHVLMSLKFWYSNESVTSFFKCRGREKIENCYTTVQFCE